MGLVAGGPNTSHLTLPVQDCVLSCYSLSCNEQPDQSQGQLLLYEQHQGRPETEKRKRAGVGQLGEREVSKNCKITQTSEENKPRGWRRGSHPEARGAEQDGEQRRPGGLRHRGPQEQGGLHQAGGYSIPLRIRDRFKRGSGTTHDRPEL